MSDDDNPALQRFRWGLGCVAKIALLVVVLSFLFLFMAAGIGSGQVSALIALLFGWLQFLSRTVPQVAWNWDLVGMAAFCSVVIALLGHKFASWVTSHVASKRGTEWRWPWKWTWCGLAAIALMFLVGMSVGGAAHQIGWVFGSQEPWYEQKPRYMEDLRRMRELDMEFRQVLLDTNTVAGVRHTMRIADSERPLVERHKRSLLQYFHILLVSTNGEHVDGVVIFPRNGEAKLRLHGYFITNADSVMFSTEDLPGLLKERESHLVAF